MHGPPDPRRPLDHNNTGAYTEFGGIPQLQQVNAGRYMLDNPNSPYAHAFNYAGQQMGVDWAALQGANESLLQTHELNMGDIQGQLGHQQQLHSLGLQGLGLDRQEMGIRQDGLGAQQQFITRREGLADQAVGAGMGFTDRREGLADRGLDNTMRGFGISEEEARAREITDQRQNKNRAIAGGAWFSPERTTVRDELADALSRSLSQIDLGRDDARLGREGQQIGFDETRFGLSHGRETQQVGFDEARQGLQQQQRLMGVAAQRLGLSEQQMHVRMQETLRQHQLVELAEMLRFGGEVDQLKDREMQLHQMAMQVALQFMGFG